MSKSTKNEKKDIATYAALDKDACPESISSAQVIAADLYRTQNERDKLIVKKNEAIREVSADYDVQITRKTDIINRLARRLKLFCLRFRETLFSSKKSYVCAGVKLAFQVSPGKVVTLGGKKEKDIVEELLASENREYARRFLSFSPTLDKDEIKAVWEEGEEGQSVLRLLGLEVVKPELFSAEPEFKAETNTKETA